MGDAAIPWLERHYLEARLVDRKGDVHRVAGWPVPADSKPAPNIL
jgi:hypothetical protein